MKRKKIFIHIGTEKTGTSSIQKNLNLNREELIKKRYYIPTSPGLENHRKLSAYSLSKDKFDDFHMFNHISTLEEKEEFEKKFIIEFQKEITNKLNDYDYLILSSEHFHSRLRSEEELYKLKNSLAVIDAEIKIIIYLRPQIDVAISHYSTSLKNGGTETLEEFIVTNCSLENYYYNYEEILALWAKVFGKENIIARLYDKNELFNNDLIDDFMNILNLYGLINKKTNNVNSSMNAIGQKLYRELNKELPFFTEYEIENNNHRQLNKKIVELFEGKGEYPDIEFAKKLQSQFDKSNESIRKNYFSKNKKILEVDYSKYINKEYPGSEKYIDFFIHILQSDLQSSITNDNIDLFRDSAIKLENVDIALSYKLMTLAKKFRPDGAKINLKVQEYKNLIKNKKNIK